jgi:hypothetical protein
MQPKNQERWQELCEQASTEQDPQKLAGLVAEIVRLLDQKLPESHDRMNNDRMNNDIPSSNPGAD